jgi:hypothetical protein
MGGFLGSNLEGHVQLPIAAAAGRRRAAAGFPRAQATARLGVRQYYDQFESKRDRSASMVVANQPSPPRTTPVRRSMLGALVLRYLYIDSIGGPTVIPGPERS